MRGLRDEKHVKEKRWLGFLTSVGVCAEEEGKSSCNSCSQDPPWRSSSFTLNPSSSPLSLSPIRVVLQLEGDGVAWETFDHSPQHDKVFFVTVFVQCLETVFLSVKVYICSAKAVIFQTARKESDEEARSNQLSNQPTKPFFQSSLSLPS